MNQGEVAKSESLCEACDCLCGDRGGGRQQAGVKRKLGYYYGWDRKLT